MNKNQINKNQINKNQRKRYAIESERTTKATQATRKIKTKDKETHEEWEIKTDRRASQQQKERYNSPRNDNRAPEA